MRNVVPALLLSPVSRRNVVPLLSLEQQLRDDVVAEPATWPRCRPMLALARGEFSARPSSAFNGPLWSLGAGLIHAEQGNAKAAVPALREVCSGTGDLANLPRGQARIATLATAAMVIGHPILADAGHAATAAEHRTLLRQPGTHAAGVAEMGEAKRLATELKMTTLVAQADAELARPR